MSTSFVFIGHIDSGKSTTVGRLLVTLGLVSDQKLQQLKQQSEQNKKSSWYLSYILDTEESERKKGKTAELNRVKVNIGENNCYLIDSPGHKDHVIEMLRASSTAEVAILMVSIKQGEFEAGFEREGQTKEHLMLACTMGVKKLIVVLNKIDTVEEANRVKRIEQVLEKVLKFSKKLYKEIRIVAVSSQEDINIKDNVFDYKPESYSYTKFDSKKAILDAKNTNLSEKIENLNLKNRKPEFEKTLIDALQNFITANKQENFVAQVIESDKHGCEIFVNQGEALPTDPVYIIDPTNINLSDFVFTKFKRSKISFPADEQQKKIFLNSIKSNKVLLKEVRDIQDVELERTDSLMVGDYYKIKPTLKLNTVMFSKGYFDDFDLKIGNVCFLTLNILKKTTPYIITKGYSAVIHLGNTMEEFKVLEVYKENVKVKIAPFDGKVNLKVRFSGVIVAKNEERVAVRDQRETVAIGSVKLLRFEDV